MKRIWLARLGLLLTPFAITFCIAEFVLRQQVPAPGVTPFCSPVLEGLPHQLRPGFTTRYKGHEVRINERGFRGPMPQEPRAAATRVAVIGDSITFGNGIALEDTMPVLLQQKLDARGGSFEVLNFGVPGYNAQHVAITLREQVLPLHPDVVVYLFVSNDVAAGGKPQDIPPDAVIDERESFPMRSAFLQWAGVRAKAILRALGSESTDGWAADMLRSYENGGRDRLRRALREMRDLCQERDIRFLVYSFPFLVRPSTNPFAPIEAAVEEECAQLKIPFQNLVQVFDEDENLTRYWATVFDSHPNRAANERVSDFLAGALDGPADG